MKAQNDRLKSNEERFMSVSETGPFLFCFSIGCHWPHPVLTPIQNKVEAEDTRARTHTLLDKAGTPFFARLPPSPPFCFKEGVHIGLAHVRFTFSLYIDCTHLKKSFFFSPSILSSQMRDVNCRDSVFLCKILVQFRIF